jgi:hypothetical protein
MQMILTFSLILRRIFPVFFQHLNPTRDAQELNLMLLRVAGSWRSCVDSPLPIRWTNSGNKYLGVWIDNASTAEQEKLQAMLLDKVTKALDAWKPSLTSMSLRGRVLAVNQFVAPKIWQLLQVQTPSPRVIKRL